MSQPKFSWFGGGLAARIAVEAVAKSLCQANEENPYAAGESSSTLYYDNGDRGTSSPHRFRWQDYRQHAEQLVRQGLSNQTNSELDDSPLDIRYRA